MSKFRNLVCIAGLWALGWSAAATAAAPIFYIIIVPAPAPWSPRGEPASMALDVLDAPVAGTEGDIAKGGVLGVHAVRARDVLVTDSVIKASQGDIPAGALLVRVDRGDKAILWCDIYRGAKLPWATRTRFNCLEDRGDTGKFNFQWAGDTQVRFLAFYPSGAFPIGALTEPAPYHHATPEQRPTARIGYKYCDKATATSPPRFAVVVSDLGKTEGWAQTGYCAFGVWPNPAEPGRITVDRLALSISPLATGGLHYRLENRIPAGPITDLVSSAGVTPVGSGPSAETPLPEPLVATGPVILHQGLLRVGETLFSATVKHGLTGTLQNRIHPGLMWRPEPPLEVGQALFAIPDEEGRIAWCAPRLQEDHKTYQTSCLMPHQVWMPHRTPALLPYAPTFNYSQMGGTNSDPSVAPGPIDLPPMTLSWVLAEITPSAKPGEGGLYRIDVMVDWGQGPEKVYRRNYRLSASGQNEEMLGARFKLSPGPDGSTLVVTAR